jgi:hypothetical protein
MRKTAHPLRSKADRFVWQAGDLHVQRLQPSEYVKQAMSEVLTNMPNTVDPYSVGRRAGLALALGLMANTYNRILRLERKAK